MSAQTILPFPVTEKRAGTVSGLAGILGSEYEIEDSNGSLVTVRLCQLDLGAGVATPLNKVFIGTTSTGRPDHQVKPCTAQTDRAYGVGMTTEALVDDDYFFVAVLGFVTCIKGDDAGNCVIGQSVRCDNDADTGKVYNSTTTAQTYLDIGFARATTSSPDDTVLVEITKKLLG